MKTCKVCEEKFTPKYTSMQKTCNNIDCAVVWGKQLQAKSYKAETKRLKKKSRDKDRSYWTKKAQEVFNKWIRIRDANKPCISCGTLGPCQWHAGHYKSVGAHPEIRFNEDNAHRQCAQDNGFKSGNIAEYRSRLQHRIGLERLLALEGHHDHQKYTIDQLKEIVKIYRSRIKESNEHSGKG